VALAHWSHSVWYDPLAPPFALLGTAVLGHKCENVFTFLALSLPSSWPRRETSRRAFCAVLGHFPAALPLRDLRFAVGMTLL
jgi:hypothetical protein